MSQVLASRLMIVCWGVTQKCTLSCPHCDREATSRDGANDLDTAECLRVIDGILEVGNPTLVLTGGDPLLRDDIFTIAKYATSRGLRVVLSTTGQLMTPDIAAKIVDAGIGRLGVSLDYADAKLHDKFRGEAGVFEKTIAGIGIAQKAGLKVEVNSVIARFTLPHLKGLLDLLVDLGVATWNPVMFVPTGRGKDLKNVDITPQEYDETLAWLFKKEIELKGRILFSGDSIPQRCRVMRQRGTPQQVRSFSRLHLRGCKAGIYGCDILYGGKVVACSMIDIEAGNLKTERFSDIWNNSPLLLKLRDLSNLKGKCAVCEYKLDCGGCRARTYGATGDLFGPDPWCTHQPAALAAK